jgi:hypothetical protein
VVSNICLLIFWNIYSIDITLLLGTVDIFYGTIGSVDTLVSNMLAQLVLHYVFSFWFKLFGGFPTYNPYIVLTKYYYSLYPFSQSIANFFLLGSLSLNICYLVTLLLVMAMLTCTTWIEGLKTYGFSVNFIPLFLNIFCMSLNLRQFIILCLVPLQIWKYYFIGLCILICWVVTSETIRINFFLKKLYMFQNCDLSYDNLYNTFLFSL